MTTYFNITQCPFKIHDQKITGVVSAPWVPHIPLVSTQLTPHTIFQLPQQEQSMPLRARLGSV